MVGHGYGHVLHYSCEVGLLLIISLQKTDLWVIFLDLSTAGDEVATLCRVPRLFSIACECEYERLL